MRKVLIFLLLATAVSAQTIADYPSFLLTQNFYLIKGDLRDLPEIVAANTLSVNLPLSQFQVTRMTKRASDVGELDRPAVLVGTPCHNDWILKVLNLTQCRVFPPSDGVVAVTTYKEQPILLVTGGSPAAVLDAAQWLADGENSAYRIQFIRIIKSAARQRVYIGNGREMLAIGQPIGQLNPVIIGNSYSIRNTRVGTYLRFPGGKVIFGKNR